MTLDPQAQAMLQALSRLRPFDFATLTGEGYRAVMDRSGLFAAGDAVHSVEEREIPGPGGGLRLRIYRPGTMGGYPVTLFFHGGGFVGCTLDTHDNVCRCLCRRADSIVVSVDYRRAPEAPFPAALEDALAALRWVHAHAAEFGGDPGRLAVAGDSAGGTLSAVVSQRCRGTGPALSHQLLVYPAVDSARDEDPDNRSLRLFQEGFYLSKAYMDRANDAYVPAGADLRDPRLSPAYADLPAGLAPAYLCTAGFDPLRDEGEAYALSLRLAGIPATLHRWSGQIHGYISMLGLMPAAEATLDCVAGELRRAFGTAAR